MKSLVRLYFWIYIHIKYGIHWKNPLYIVRILRNLIKAKWYMLTKKNTFVLRGIDFAPTFTCNFNCEHCFAERLMDKNREPLTVEDYKRICGEAMKLGCLSFSLQGGEIFLKKDWREIIKALQPKRNHILITTNGSLLPEERIVELKKMGLDTLYFSVDSGIAEEHDKFRRHEGSFEKIMKAIGHCKKHKVKVVINTCVTKQGLYSEGFKRLMEFSHKNRILLQTIFPSLVGNYSQKTEVMVDETDVRYYYKLRKENPFITRDLDNNYGKWGCPAVKEVLYITAYGDVFPCPFIHATMGNVRESTLKEVREVGLKNHWFDHYYRECLTQLDDDFMNLYYPLIEKQPTINIEQLEKEGKN